MCPGVRLQAEEGPRPPATQLHRFAVRSVRRRGVDRWVSGEQTPRAAQSSRGWWHPSRANRLRSLVLNRRYPFLTVSREAADDASVAAFEETIGFRLPAEYRQFLLDTNGGWSEWQMPLPDATEEYTLMCHFFGLRTRSREGNMAYPQHNCQEVLDDPSLVLIADCFYGYLALLPGLDTVWYVEQHSGEKRDDLRVLRPTLLAPSFRAFTELLRPPKEPYFDQPVSGRADPHPLRKLLRARLTEEDLTEIASLNYGQDVAENLIAFRTLLDNGPGGVTYIGGDAWECWLLGQHDREGERAAVRRAFCAFALLGEVAQESWTYVSNYGVEAMVEVFTSAVLSLGRTWYEPALLFVRWSSAIAPPHQSRAAWRKAIRLLQ